jgi:pimeloyl-ACP methyl ester carboxylesterase
MAATHEHQTPLPYSLEGTGEPTILLIHGFLDSAAVWTEVRTRLKDAGLATAALDLPGMGGISAAPESISLDRYADDVGSVVAAMGGRIVLVGQSMGAQIAELVAARHSDQVAGLVLLTPVPLGGVGAPEEAVAPMKSSGGKPDAQRDLRRSLSFDLDPASLDALTALGTGVDPAVVARLVDVWNSGHPDGQSPSRYPGPVLIVRGAADPFVDDALAERTVTRFTAPRLAMVERAGHWAHFERPGVVAELIARFVDTRLPPR